MVEVTVGFIDSPHQLDQPSERHEPKWESTIKEEISKFHGNLIPNIWIRWLDHPQKTHLQDFNYSAASKERMVKLISLGLRGGAPTWWEQLQTNRRRRYKDKLHEWHKMKKKLRQKFLPFKYVQTHYKSLHSQVRWFSRSMQTNPSYSSLRLVHPKVIMLILKPNLPTLARSLQYPMLNPIPPESESAN